METATNTLPDAQATIHYTQIVDFVTTLLNFHSDNSLLRSDHAKQFTQLMCLKYNELYPEKALSNNDISYIVEGARLHDIGKISIPDAVLNKRGALTDAEFVEVKRHTYIGANIVDQMADLYHMGSEKQFFYDICLYHHERYDGSGYPEHLKGDEIPLWAQIVSIVDVYDALTQSDYKLPLPHDAAVSMILRGECGEFSPLMLELFAAVAPQFENLLGRTDDRKRLIATAYARNRKNYWICKRTLDFTLSLLALIVLSPLLLLISLIIFLDDPHGSPIFKQTRLGRHKKPFTMYKFRTMVVNAEALKQELEDKNEKDGPVFKMANDPRITRVGRFLRKTSLDELPQLINIVKGDMSIVGPRPPLPSEVEQYSRYHEMRLSVTPGLTCDWQIQPSRDTIGFEQWVDMDVGYIGSRSIRQDIRIVFMTVLSMIRKDGT